MSGGRKKQNKQRVLRVNRPGAVQVGDASRGRLDQIEHAIHRAEQRHASFAGHAAAVEATLNDTPAQTTKLDSPHIDFFGTVWCRNRLLAKLDSTPR